MPWAVCGCECVCVRLGVSARVSRIRIRTPQLSIVSVIGLLGKEFFAAMLLRARGEKASETRPVKKASRHGPAFQGEETSAASQCQQAIAFAEDYARTEDRGYKLARAALDGDLATMRALTDGLVAAATPVLASNADVAMRTFVDFIDPRCPGTPIFAAAQDNHIEAVRYLHELRGDLDKQTAVGGGTPVHIAAARGNLAMLQMLYDLGAGVNQPSRVAGPLPIHSAAIEGKADVVAELVAMRADVHARDNKGRTPAVWACENDHGATLRCLLEAGVDPRVGIPGFSLADICEATGSEGAKAVVEEFL